MSLINFIIKSFIFLFVMWVSLQIFLAALAALLITLGIASGTLHSLLTAVDYKAAFQTISTISH